MISPRPLQSSMMDTVTDTLTASLVVWVHLMQLRRTRGQLDQGGTSHASVPPDFLTPG
jgi:hypothetical protein